MKIVDFLPAELILPDLKASDKLDAIHELVGFIAARRPNLDKAAIAGTLLERERLGSTGIGEGVAIPHGKLKGLNELLGCLGRSREGIDFQAIDGRPAKLFVTLLAPENSAGIHLQALARISRLFKNVEFRERLLAADGQRELFDIIASEDSKY